ncbi:unnamed protein product [Rhizoctonia solani]|uniref:Uncharacterized protein n=1 Tax=Rhizoctonia solani TaxID=456999 RepID=A0A8H2XHK1_9AGAM|nr:unnamed protein product [Rhizoctonia solani]
MIGLVSPYLSPDEIESERSARTRRERHSPPPMPVLTASVYVHTGLNEVVLMPVPLAWPSIADHDPEVNLSVTQFLFTLQHLYEVYTAWGDHQATWEEVKDTFNELLQRWHTVEDSYDDCCRTSVREIEQGLAKIQRLCGATFNHKGPNWVRIKDNQSYFSSSVRDDIIGKLKELHHSNTRA